jgi:hypothetical protein
MVVTRDTTKWPEAMEHSLRDDPAARKTISVGIFNSAHPPVRR